MLRDLSMLYRIREGEGRGRGGEGRGGERKTIVLTRPTDGYFASNVIKQSMNIVVLIVTVSIHG